MLRQILGKEDDLASGLFSAATYLSLLMAAEPPLGRW